MVFSILSAAYGLYTLPTDQGHAVGFAGFVMVTLAELSILFFTVALILAYLMRRGGITKTVGSVILILAGAFVYVTSGFFPVFVLSVGIGSLGLFEEHLRRSSA